MNGNDAYGNDAPSPTTVRQIAERMAADLTPVRPIAPARNLVAAFVAIFVSIVALAVCRLGAPALAVMTPLQSAAMLGALGASTVLLAHSLANQMVPGSRHTIPPRLLPVGIMAVLAIASAVLFQFQHETDFWRRTWWCIRTGTPIGALAVFPFWLMLRRGAILSPRMTGAATGLFAGLAGTSVLTIHCRNLDAWHILVAHLGVAILCALAGLATAAVAEIYSVSATQGRRRF